jgi:D-3-phosphoglycerate dehydrogenase / 2-oxoglutarate reductase
MTTGRSMGVHAISCLDVFAPSVQKAIRDVAPPDFAIRFARTYDREEQTDLVANADVVLVGGATLSREMIEGATRLKFIQKWGIGVDKIDTAAARAAGIPVAITAGANAGPVAELAIALMLAVYRRIPFADRNLREGIWLKPEMRSWCYQLDGKTIGLLGFGAISRMVAHRLRGFDVQIIYYDLNRADRVTERTLRATYVSLDDLLRRSDIVSLHTPLTERTRHLIDREAIAKMRDGAVLINTARGGIVDEDALCDALEAGKLLGAGLDAFEVEPLSPASRLAKLDRVVLTPHAGGGVFDNVANVAEHALGNIGKFLRREPLPAADIVVPVPHATGG